MGSGEHHGQVQPQQQLVVAGGESQSADAWQMFYDDESVNAPVPWWFNSVTGESTWECPAALMPAESQVGDTGPEGESKMEHVGNGLAVVESGVDQGWTQLWSEEYQVGAEPAYHFERFAHHTLYVGICSVLPLVQEKSVQLTTWVSSHVQHQAR